MPSLEGATEWFNATGAAAAVEVEGHPTLVHFWSVSCGMCKENLPRVAEWREGRAEDGLRVVAIHMPRYEADTDVEAVREAVVTYGITEPCAVDHGHRLREGHDRRQRPDHGPVGREGRRAVQVPGARQATVGCRGED
jgi:thiol-disulfide isomerase/thioredoxin